MPEVHDLNRVPTRPEEPTGDAALRAALVALAPVAAADPQFRANLSHPDLPDVILSLRGGPDGPWIDVVETAGAFGGAGAGAAAVTAGGATAVSGGGGVGSAPDHEREMPEAVHGAMPREVPREPEPAPLPQRVPGAARVGEAEPDAAPDPFFASLSAIVAADAAPAVSTPAPMPDLLADPRPQAAAAAEPPSDESRTGPLPPSEVRLVPMAPVEESFAGGARAADAPFGSPGAGSFGWAPDTEPSPSAPLATDGGQGGPAAVPDEERDLVARLAEVLSGDDWDGPSTGVPGR